MFSSNPNIAVFITDMFVIHSGWVGSTEIGDGISSWIAENAPQVPNIPLEESAAGCMKVLKDATVENSGSFYNFDGTKIPW
jgi:hypothetical protein